MNNLNIPIKNIYYMLTYAYKSLKIDDYKSMSNEKFDSLADLYSEVLSLSVARLVRRGLWKEYIRKSESSSVIKGKINLNESVKDNSVLKKQMIVEYDVLSENIKFNQIIKSMLLILVFHSQVKKEHQKKLRQLLVYFSEVDEISLNYNIWKDISYNPQNVHYQLTLDICRYFFEELLLDESVEGKRQQQIKDNQELASLFEKFVYTFYLRETDYQVSRPKIYWDTDNDMVDALPVMQTDIVLKKNKHVIIIDTKFYQHNMSRRMESSNYKQIPGNLYQLFSYIQNYHKKPDEIVSGILLYAATKDTEQPNHCYIIKGQSVSVTTLDLSKDFNDIKNQLLLIERTLDSF